MSLLHSLLFVAVFFAHTSWAQDPQTDALNFSNEDKEIAVLTIAEDIKRNENLPDPTPVIAERIRKFVHPLKMSLKKSPGLLAITWGYHKAWISKSDVHFSRPDGAYDFIAHDVKASDRPSFSSILPKKGEPYRFDVPQYQVSIRYTFPAEEKNRLRFGMKLQQIHSKYVPVPEDQREDGQNVWITGTYFGGEEMNGKAEIGSYDSTYWEYTDGLNETTIGAFFDYAFNGNKKIRASVTGGLNAGVVIPATYSVIGNEIRDHHFDISGLAMHAEGGLKITAWNRLFLESLFIASFVDMKNGRMADGGKIQQKFYHFKAATNIGYMIKIKPKSEKESLMNRHLFISSLFFLGSMTSVYAESSLIEVPLGEICGTESQPTPLCQWAESRRDQGEIDLTPEINGEPNPQWTIRLSFGPFRSHYGRTDLQFKTPEVDATFEQVKWGERHSMNYYNVFRRENGGLAKVFQFIDEPTNEFRIEAEKDSDFVLGLRISHPKSVVSRTWHDEGREIENNVQANGTIEGVPVSGEVDLYDTFYEIRLSRQFYEFQVTADKIIPILRRRTDIKSQLDYRVGAGAGIYAGYAVVVFQKNDGSLTENQGTWKPVGFNASLNNRIVYTFPRGKLNLAIGHTYSVGRVKAEVMGGTMTVPQIRRQSVSLTLGVKIKGPKRRSPRAL